MGLTCKIGDIVHSVDVRNSDLQCDNLLGLSMTKEFRPSTSNIVGTDLSKYKIVGFNEFAVDFMSVIRVHKMPIALNRTGKDIIVSPAYGVFAVNDEKIVLPEYLMLWFMRPEFDRYADFKSDSAIRGGYDWNELCNTDINLPSIDEQRRIVHDYQVITDRIKLLQKINKNLLNIITTTYTEIFKTKEYQMVAMKELCSKIGSGATPRGGKDAYFEEGISLIRSTNVYDYFFSYNNLAHINDEQAAALSNVKVEAYDVLFNITGVSIARCCIVPDDVLPARVNQHVMIIRPIAGRYMSYYLLITLCDQTNKNLLLGIGQSGSTREAINKQEMENFKIPLPDLEEIEMFGHKAEVFFDQIQQNSHELNLLQTLQNISLSILVKGA